MIDQTLSPLDARYREQVSELVPIFSEKGLVKNRLQVEVEYLIWLAGVLDWKLSREEERVWHGWVENFSDKDFERIRAWEEKCKHDVKAVEYFIRERLDEVGMDKWKTWVHWGMTSEDVNNIAQTLQLRSGNEVMLKELGGLLEELLGLARDGAGAVMLGRTHGQAAVGTTMGKEILVHLDKIARLAEKVDSVQWKGKLGGAVGTKAAHVMAYPEVDWEKEEIGWLKRFGLEKSSLNTQILNTNDWVELFGLWSRVAVLIEGLAKDLWWYVALDYFRQSKREQEVGSSTMPQKVNPINLENAEGNAKMAYGLFNTFERVFSYSRLQRDLSDSTMRRSWGVAYGYLLLGLKSMRRGMGKLEINEDGMRKELENHYEVLGEAVQCLMKSRGQEDAYERVKEWMRGENLDKGQYQKLIGKMEIEDELGEILWEMTPGDYIGNAQMIVEEQAKYWEKRINKLAKRVES